MFWKNLIGLIGAVLEMWFFFFIKYAQLFSSLYRLYFVKTAEVHVCAPSVDTHTHVCLMNVVIEANVKTFRRKPLMYLKLQ